MPRSKKFTRSEVKNLLRHNDRTIQKQKDHIDPNRAHLNRRLSPDRQGREYEYFKERLKTVELGRKRADRVYCVEWIVTAPRILAPSEVNRFFDVCYAHLCKKYGGEHNIISCYQHEDEDGSPHIHLDVLPLIKTESGVDKLNAKILIDKKHLSGWHGELDAVLIAAGLPPTQNGATGKFGRNRTVAELKRTTERARELENEPIKLKFNLKPNERNVEHERNR